MMLNQHVKSLTDGKFMNAPEICQAMETLLATFFGH